LVETSTVAWDGWHILAVEGEFVVKYLAKVREHLEEFAKQSTAKVAFDLTKTTYIDSSAITLMLNYQKRLRAQNGNIVVFGASEDAKSIFSIVGLDNSITVFDTREQFEQAVKM